MRPRLVRRIAIFVVAWTLCVLMLILSSETPAHAARALWPLYGVPPIYLLLFFRPSRTHRRSVEKMPEEGNNNGMFGLRTVSLSPTGIAETSDASESSSTIGLMLATCSPALGQSWQPQWTGNRGTPVAEVHTATNQPFDVWIEAVWTSGSTEVFDLVLTIELGSVRDASGVPLDYVPGSFVPTGWVWGGGWDFVVELDPSGETLTATCLRRAAASIPPT